MLFTVLKCITMLFNLFILIKFPLSDYEHLLVLNQSFMYVLYYSRLESQLEL